MTINEAVTAVMDRMRVDFPWEVILDADEPMVIVKVPMEDHKAINDKKTGPILRLARAIADEHGFTITGGRAVHKGNIRGFGLLIGVG